MATAPQILEQEISKYKLLYDKLRRLTSEHDNLVRSLKQDKVGATLFFTDAVLPSEIGKLGKDDAGTA